MTKPIRFVAALLVLTLATGTPAQERTGNKFGAKAFVTAIELVVDVTDASGKTPTDLTPADFVIMEDEDRREVVSVEYLGGGIPTVMADTTVAPPSAAPRAADWQIVIWFDGLTSDRGLLNESVRDLKKQMPQLLSMGTVTILYSDFTTKALVTSSRNPRAINDALDGVMKNGIGDRIARLRRQFIMEAEKVTSVTLPEGVFVLNTVSNDIAPYVSEELRLLSIARTNLLRWIARVPRRQPRMLMYVGGGFDLDPVDFYATVFESTPDAENGRDTLRRSENKVALDAENDKVARALALEGWIAIAVGGTGSYSMASGVERGGSEMVSNRGTNNAMPVHLFSEPSAPLRQYASETGGALVMNVKQLPEVMDRLRNRVRLTYQVDREP
ncbi:MAG TPA: hypothetical protein VF787_28575, partial [Thermoanaerobaculia bacterium]